MYKRLTKFINNHALLYSSQNGFRKRHNTQQAVLDILNDIHTNMENGKFMCGIFIDLKKAFDTVDYNILLAKLQNYGIRGIVNEWLDSYLTGRKQYTYANGNISDLKQTMYGVPQGSVLGPLLFLLYINDLYKASSKFQFYLFADDTSLICANNDLNKLEEEVNLKLSKVNLWLVHNKLTLNADKSNYIIFRPCQKVLRFQPIIRIHDNTLNSEHILEMRHYIKYLGIFLDSNLSWKYHVHYLCQKISKTLGIIAKLWQFVPRHVLLTIYYSLISPYLNYGICAWGQCAKTYLYKLLVLQKRAHRLIFFTKPREHALPLFLETKQLPISFLYFDQISQLMHDVHNNLVPENIVSMFQKVTHTHQY